MGSDVAGAQMAFPLAGEPDERALAGQIAALRTSAAASAVPVQLRLVEALWQRASRLEGLARSKALQRLEQRLCALEARLQRPGNDRPGPLPASSPFAGLLERLDHGLALASVDGNRQAAAAGQGVGELKARRHFRRQWMRLKTEHQLGLALAEAPQDAGPLNSHALLVQALVRLHQLAPSYVHGLLGYGDALLVLDSLAPPRRAAEAGASPAGRRQRRQRRRPQA